MYIKKSIIKINNFICIGAIHLDNILKLKNRYYKNRTNPIIKHTLLGGVAYNIANKLSFLGIKGTLISLNCSRKEKKILKKNNLNFIPLTKKIFERSYSSIISKKGEMLLGLADMDIYDKKLKVRNLNNYKNKIIILDLNFSSDFINSIINKYYFYNLICINGTSAHKIMKINNLLKKINILILNKQESINLTNKKNIKDALNYIIKKNDKITLVITNGRYSINAYHNKIIYTCKPPQLIIKNENKAGDIMSSFFYYYFFQKLDFEKIISKSAVAGSLYVSGFNSTKKNYLKMIDKISKKIKVKYHKFYG
tara:strand:+ start:6304 stop:7233 length:930 start_codon:yes stop_codon:yes gene_type:complete